MQTWDAFATITGGAAAALTGLLFVAVSVRADYIARSQELRNRAAQTLILFGTVLVIAVLMAIPGQGYRTLGAELLALGVLLVLACTSWTGARRPAGAIRRSRRCSKPSAPTWSHRSCSIAAAIVLVLGLRAGLYVLVAPVLTALVGGVTSAWLFLTKITE